MLIKKLVLHRRFSEFFQTKIRNFCIIAHIDHGKSTLADRLIEMSKEVMLESEQVLDKLQVEQERGITIKSQTVRLEYDWEPKPWNLTTQLSRLDLENFLDQTELSEDFEELIDMLETLDTQGRAFTSIYNLSFDVLLQIS